jgi:hypothetical protein
MCEGSRAGTDQSSISISMNYGEHATLREMGAAFEWSRPPAL